MQPRPWSLTAEPQPQPGPRLDKSTTSLCLSFLSKECSELTVCVQGSTVEHMTEPRSRSAQQQEGTPL